MRRQLVRLWITGAALLLIGCSSGGSGGTSGTDGTTGTDGTDGTDGGPAVWEPMGCWAPDEAEVAIDCELLCKKVAACNYDQSECSFGCQQVTRYLRGDVASTVEECFVSQPCAGDDVPPAFAMAACIQQLPDTPGYQPLATTEADCTAIRDGMLECGFQDGAQQVDIVCDLLAPGMIGEVFSRALTCLEKPCASRQACFDESSCILDGVEAGAASAACSTDDRAVLQADVTGETLAAALSCAATCADDAACAATCVGDSAGIGPGCSGCVADLASCAQLSCDSACADGAPGAACTTCVENSGCASAFESCAGFGPPLPPAEGRCTGETDAKRIASEEVLYRMTRCLDKCGEDGVCAADCMAGWLDVSEACSLCTGDLVACAGAAGCAQYCEDGPGTTCIDCVSAANCVSAFESCAPTTIIASDKWTCTLPADRSAMVSGEAWSAASTCAAGCAGEAACVSACMTDGEVVSDRCGECFGSVGVCTREHCADACAGGLTSLCFQCLEANQCDNGFADCGGMAPYAAPTAGQKTCDQTVDCLVGCADSQCQLACKNAADPAVLTDATAVAECVAACDGQPFDCIANTCWSAFSTCTEGSATLSCSGVRDCIDGCHDSPCLLDCVKSAENPEALQDFTESVDCIAAFCDTGGGNGQVGTECVALVQKPGGVCYDEVATCEGTPGNLTTFDCAMGAECLSICAGKAACLPICEEKTDFFQVDEAKALQSCNESSCSGSGDPLCIVQQCWSAYDACYTDGPNQSLTCNGVWDCLIACEATPDPFCSSHCLAAGSQTAAATYLALNYCVADLCTSPTGDLVDGCPEQVTAPGQACYDELEACD